jgi:hypothetical protein
MNDFLSHLRQEKLDTQNRRAEFIKLKFLLVAGLFGIGNWEFSGISNNYLLLYLVPIIGFALDLYIHGETFAIRRIGFFVKEIDHNIPIEHSWEQFVNKNRDKFTLVGTNVVSGLIFFGTFFILQIIDNNQFRFSHPLLHYSWVIVNFMIWLLFIYFSLKLHRSLLRNKTPIETSNTD